MASHYYRDGICDSWNVYSTKFPSHSIALTFWRGNIGNGSPNSGGTRRVSALVTFFPKQMIICIKGKHLRYSTRFFHYPNKIKLDLTSIPKLSEQSLPNQSCFRIDWNIAKWQKEENSESESGGQMALSFILKQIKVSLVRKTIMARFSSSWKTFSHRVEEEWTIEDRGIAVGLGDILPQGHFAPRTFCPKDILPHWHFAQRTFCPKDILPQDILPQLS